MNRLGVPDIDIRDTRHGLNRRLVVDRVFAIAFVLAVLALDMAVVRFAHYEPLIGDQTYIVPNL